MGKVRSDRPVVVVTGGGGGIGAAVAEEVGRRGAHVVTLDPLVTVDGSERLPAAGESTAGRIVAAGGSAEASSASVTDREAVRELFDRLVGEHGRLDGVVNVAGITRPTSFTRGSDQDWRDVLTVHLDGYRNVLDAALPLMAAAGRGRIVGVTSGSGWRPADTGAYGCAKRAVASLTWQLGRVAPPGVAVNAMSPIAATRMVTAALERARRAAAEAQRKGGRDAARTPATGGLSLGSMPAPEAIGPVGAHLVSEAFAWCRGRILFAGGSEVALIDEPRLLEVVRSQGVASLARVLDTVTPAAWIPAESAQATNGATNPRFASVFADPGDPDLGRGSDVEDAAAGGAVAGEAAVRTCALVSDRPELTAALTGALERRSVACRVIEVADAATGFAGARAALDAGDEQDGPPDAVVVALRDRTPSVDERPWAQVLADHEGLVGRIHHDASWARAVADLSAEAGRPMRLVTVTDAVTAGGRSRAQAAAQHARSSLGSTAGRVAAFAVALESGRRDDLGPAAELAAHLLCAPDTPALSGAELVAGAGWLGLRSHPRPTGSVSYGDGGVPGWLDDVLRAVVGDPSPMADGRQEGSLP